MTRRLLLVTALMAVGCGELSDAEDGTARGDTATGFDATLDGLRIDVFPGSNISDGTLPAQSFRDIGADGAWDVNLPLRSPVRIHGTLTGLDANPTADVGVPGEQEVRVLGTFKAFVPSTPMAVSQDTDEDGEVREVLLVPSADYTIAWIPQDPAELPFYVSTGEVIEADTDLSVALDYGVPLYGRVFAEGSPLEGAMVQAVEPTTGIGGPVVEVDPDGSYMLRVYPGEYELHVTHRGIYVPTQVLPVLVDDAEGTEQNIEYTTLSTYTVDGVVRDAENRPLDGVTVRFTATTVFGAPAGRLVYEATSNQNGDYIARLVPGRYQVEYMPRAESSWGPAMTQELLVEEEAQLPSVQLQSRPQVGALLTGPDGSPISGATVRAAELGFSGHVFESTTDGEGRFVLAASDTTLAWTFVPPSEVAAAIGHAEATPDAIDGGAIALSEGQLITGHVSFDGEAASYTLIDVRDSDDLLYGSALTDGEGNFEVRVDPYSVGR